MTESNPSSKVSNPGDSLDGIVRGLPFPCPLDRWVRREWWEYEQEKSEMRKAWLEEIFRLLGLPDGDMGAMKNYVTARCLAEKMAKAWELAKIQKLVTPNAGTQRPGTSDAEPATRTPMPGSLE
jgi:hypothetical protein